MMQSAERLLGVLPEVRSWIHDYVARHAGQARPVAELSFSRLSDYYSPGLLQRTRSVVVDQPKSPPLGKLGLPELDAFEHMSISGVTYDDTFFVRLHDSKNESLFFHELVHVVQWNELGFDKFLLVYGIGLMTFGYRDSPLEQMAYRLQAEFQSRKPIVLLEAKIRAEVRALLTELERSPEVASLLGQLQQSPPAENASAKTGYSSISQLLKGNHETGG